MKRLTNKGFGLKEFMVGLLLLIVLGAAIYMFFLDSKEKNFTTSKVASSSFADGVMYYKDKYYRGDGKYYLHEVQESGFVKTITNPIEGNNPCDIYNSFVVLKGSEKHVTLVCDNYLIEGVQNGPHKIYEFTPWQDSKEEMNESKVLYNYKRNGETILPNYVSDLELVGRFNKNEKKFLDSIQEIKKQRNYEVVSKEMHRTKTLVKELS